MAEARYLMAAHCRGRFEAREHGDRVHLRCVGAGQRHGSLANLDASPARRAATR